MIKNLLFTIILMFNVTTLFSMEAAEKNINDKIRELIETNQKAICKKKNLDAQKVDLVLFPPAMTQQLMQFVFAPFSTTELENNLRALNKILLDSEICFCMEESKKYVNGFPLQTRDYIRQVGLAYHDDIVLHKQFTILETMIQNILEKNKFKDETQPFIATKLQS